MGSPDLASEIVRDLLRSAWIVEKARGRLYRSWSAGDASFGSPAENCERRAELIEQAIRASGRSPDEALVEPHAGWMASVMGGDPQASPLAPIFLARLGDWVDGHAGPFLGSDAERLAGLDADAKAAAVIPSSLPQTPGFERLEIPEVEAPGDVLFRFGILADMHVGSPHAERRVEAAINDLNASGAELVIQLGDITDHGDRDEFEGAVELLSRLEMPVVTMMGNHDVYSIGEQRISGREYYGNAFGREPDGVKIEHKGFTFAVLDSIEHATSPFSPFDLVAGRFIDGQSGGAIVRGSLTPPQHEILADIAGPDGGPAFIFLHHPTQPFTGFPPVLFGLRDEDAGRIHAVCDSGNVWGVFAGHTHRNARTRDYDGVPVQEVAIPRDYPHGFGLVDVTENGYAYRFRQLSDDNLLRAGYEASNDIIRRYSTGSGDDLAFAWTRPGA